MISSNPVINNSCQFDIKCEKSGTNHCQGCGEQYCVDHYLEHQKKVEDDLNNIIEKHQLINEKWKSLMLELSSNGVLDSIKQIYQFSLQSDQIEDTLTIFQQQIKQIFDQDFENQNSNLENEINKLKKDIEELQSKLEEIINDNQQRISEEEEQLNTDNINDHLTPTIQNGSRKKKRPVELIFRTFKNNKTNKTEQNSALSHLLFRQPSPSILDLQQNPIILSEQKSKTHEEEEDEEEDDEEMIVYLDSENSSKISHKVRFSNNIVRYLRGPFKTMVHGTMHAVDLFAQGTHISDDALQAVKNGLERQNQMSSEKQLNKNSPLSTFAQITEDWKMEGENPDRGFSSPSIWMRNPQGQRILIKIQEHPLCAANEWLAYVLGRLLALPVNQVQIAIHQGNLVSLHADVASDEEKPLTFMDLPKQRRKSLITDPIMESMDIFDRIIQNVDRNQQNILITMPKTTDINDETAKSKIYLIDHSNCFGMGKLNGISLVASKFHSHHLAVVKFDPIQKSKQFEQYLTKIPVEDRPFISKTLNRFSMITNEQFDSWMSEIQDLLSTSQYNRIHGVLYRQRDIAKRYTTQWGISPRSESVKSDKTKQDTDDYDHMVTRL